MDLKLSFKQLHPTGGDEIAPYEVTTNRGCTLKELIEKIKSGTSFGNILIYDASGNYYLRGYQNIPIENFPKGLFDKWVRKIDSAGGWGRMDFRIWL